MNKYSAFSDKNQWVSQINQLLYVATDDKSFWQLKDNEVKLKSFRVLAPQDRCPCQIRNTLAINPKPKKDRSKQLEIAYQEWAWCREILKTRNLTDAELRQGLEQIKSKIKIFGYERENGLQPIESYTKGTARYDRKKAFEAMDFIKNHSNDDWELYFFTVTCATKIYKNRANAWEHYDKTHIKKPLENLRKHYGCEYIRALESFASGYPHAHCVLAFPKGTYPEWASMENKEDVKSGKIYNWIKNNLGSPVFNLQVAKGDNTKFYLTKYLTKYAKSNVLELLEKKGKFSKSERKAVQELVYVKAFRKHTLEHCKDRSEAGLKALAEKKAELIRLQQVSEKKHKKMIASAIKEKDRAKRWRQLLTSLCINSPLKCDRVMKFMSAESFKNTFNFYPEPNKPLTHSQENTFNSRCLSGGCGGCFYSELVKFVLGDDSTLFTKKSGYSPEIRNNDEDFMQFVARRTTYFFKNLCFDYCDFYHLAEKIPYQNDSRDLRAIASSEKWKESVKDEQLNIFMGDRKECNYRFFSDKYFDRSVERSYNNNKEVDNDSDKRQTFRKIVKNALIRFSLLAREEELRLLKTERIEEPFN